MVKFKIDFPFSMLNKNELILNNSVTPEVTQKKKKCFARGFIEKELSYLFLLLFFKLVDQRG